MQQKICPIFKQLNEIKKMILEVEKILDKCSFVSYFNGKRKKCLSAIKERYPMFDFRKSKERAIDRILLAYLLKIYREKRSSIGITLIQKVSFLSELKMIENAIKGMNYTFFRWHHGPMSKQIYSDLYLLRNMNWLKKNHFDITRIGHSVLDEFLRDHYKKNEEVFNIIDMIIRKFASYNAKELTRYIYKMKLCPVEIAHNSHRKADLMKIEEIPCCWDIICKLREDEANICFAIDDDWLESLELGFILTPETEENSKITAKITKEELFNTV